MDTLLIIALSAVVVDAIFFDGHFIVKKIQSAIGK